MTFQIHLDHFPLRLFNTASRQKETLVPLQDRHVRMYTCGPLFIILRILEIFDLCF